MDSVKSSVMTTRKVIIENGFYHIIQRAPGRELLFIEDKDCLRFLHLLKDTSRMFSIKIFCFALLSNHLHILIKTKHKNLDKAMKYLFQSYAQGFNGKYQRKGHVFCGVYRAVLCKDDIQLLTVSLYIHLNPFKAGLTKDVCKYRWFSLEPYIKPIRSEMVKSDFILSMLHKNINEARIIYKSLIKGARKLEYTSILKDNKAIKNFFGVFVDWAKGQLSTFYTKGDIASFFELERKIDEIKLKKRIKKPEEKEAILYLVEQLRSQGYSYGEIASKVGFSRMSVFRLLNSYKSV